LEVLGNIVGQAAQEHRFSQRDISTAREITTSGIEIIDFDPRFAGETVKMWRASKKKAIGQAARHNFSDDLKFLTNKLARTDRVFLAVETTHNSVVGLLAIDGAELDQLYVHTGYQGRGIGSSLIALAKRLSPAGLRLFTFERNRAARAFYEKHGFVETGRGFPNEEMLPDIRYEWPGPR
jgi:ribosomal protein S18 acetylase RimI-like enzyme